MKTKDLPLKPQKNLFDIWLLGATLLLVVVGLLAIYDASVVAAFRDFGDKLYYFKNQLIWASLGFLSLAFFSFFDYHRLLKISPLLLGFSIFLLVIVLIPHIGTKIYGARRWINISGFTFQPSEFAKLATILYGSAIMTRFENFKIKLFDVFLVLFLPILTIAALVLLEPDFGTSLIFIGIILTIYFVGNGTFWHFLLLIPVTIVGSVAMIMTHAYRFERLKSFLNPSYDPQGASYQINQILIALTSGGILGVGLGGSRSKFAFVPEIQSDAIFAVWVEELGFIGAIFLIGLFLFLIYRAINIARNACDYQGRILAMAIVSLLSIQTLINLASIVVLIPLTGVPLPFISYGGSSLFVTLTAIGILSNIRRQSLGQQR